jgi:hypothetical protein
MDQPELETSHSCGAKGLANSLLIRARFSSLFRFRQRRWQSVSILAVLNFAMGQAG